MLLYQATAVVVEVLEDESLLVGVCRLPLIVVSLSIPTHKRFQLLLALRVVMGATGRGKQLRQYARRLRPEGPAQVLQGPLVVFVELLIVFHHLLLVVLQRVEGVEEGQHGLREMLRLTDVHLHEEGEGDVVEDVLSQAVEGVVGEVLEQLRFLCERHVVLKVIRQLLSIRMHIGVD